jgi:hypothetical protein
MIDHKKEAVEYCLNTFNFERVHKVMEQVEWRWTTRDGLKVPTIVQLVLVAQQRLNDAWDERTTIESGGLRAVYVQADMDEDGVLQPPALELLFILTQTQSY